jgi:hypothetical protein
MCGVFYTQRRRSDDPHMNDVALAFLECERSRQVSVQRADARRESGMNALYRAGLLLWAAGCGSSSTTPVTAPSTTTGPAEPRAEAWGNEPCGAKTPGPPLAFATGPTSGALGEKLLGSVTLPPERQLPATIAIGDRDFEVRAFFRRCYEGRLQFLGVGITVDSNDKAIGFSPPLPVYGEIPRKANTCVLDLVKFNAESCPGHDHCGEYPGLTELNACSNQMYIQVSTRSEPPNAEEKARGVTAVVYSDQVGVASYKADPVSGDFTEMTLERRVVRSESNPSMLDQPSKR